MLINRKFRRRKFKEGEEKVLIRDEVNIDSILNDVECYRYPDDSIYRIFTGSDDRLLRAYKFENNKLTFEKSTDMNSFVMCMEIFHEKARKYASICVGGYSGAITIVDLPELKIRRSVQLDGSSIWRMKFVDEFSIVCGNWYRGKTVLCRDYRKDDKGVVIYNSSYGDHVFSLKKLKSDKERVVLITNIIVVINWKLATNVEFDRTENLHSYPLETFICKKTKEERILAGAGKKILVFTLKGEKLAEIGVNTAPSILKEEEDEASQYLRINDTNFIVGTDKGSIYSLHIEGNELRTQKISRKNVVDRIGAIVWVNKEMMVFCSTSSTLSVSGVDDLEELMELEMWDMDLMERTEYIREKEEWIDFRVRISSKEEIEASKWLLFV